VGSTAASERDLAVRDVQRVAEFRFALRRFTRQTELVARQASLTPQWYLLLLMIKGATRGDERATVGELSERMQLAQSTVTELVNRAQRAGLVDRTASAADARVGHVALTLEGERRFRQAFRGLAEERRALRHAIAALGD
jgi:DNA-binding MarR family transcriptional regulator